MTVLHCFNECGLEEMARILGEEVNGGQLTEAFTTCHIEDTSCESTKWRRIYRTLLSKQKQDKCASNVAAFIQQVMQPVRFQGSGRYEGTRKELNVVLAFEGLQLDEQGKLRTVPAAKTLPEAEERARILSGKLQGRNIHQKAVMFCTAELMQDNYFHAVFEATKSLAQRIRDMTGLQEDGWRLVDQAFSVDNPFIAFNSLQTRSERNEHTGFAMLLKGCFSAIRSRLAHEPKILWNWDTQDDPADYLTLISLLHRKLDVAQVVRRG